MYDNDAIVKDLLKEVQLLRDELAIMQRKYEDILYNLDDNNFSSKILEEKDNMKAEISVTSEKISAAVTREDLSNELLNYSSIEQTADMISSTVEEIVGDTYATKSYVKQTAGDITSMVETIENGTFKNKTLFQQTDDTFLFDGDNTVFTGIIYLTDNNGNKRFAIWHDETQGYPQVRLGTSGKNTISTPIVIGNINNGEHNVFIGSDTSNNRIVTRGWIENEFKITFG